MCFLAEVVLGLRRVATPAWNSWMMQQRGCFKHLVMIGCKDYVRSGDEGEESQLMGLFEKQRISAIKKNVNRGKGNLYKN